MIQKLTLACLFLGFFCITEARAEFYTGIGFGSALNGGGATTNGDDSSFKNSYGYSIFGGYELPITFMDARVEAEFLYLKAPVKDGDDRNFKGVMFNAVGVIPFVPVVDPYVGLGIGYSRFDHTNTVAWQAIGGVDYQLPFAPVVIGGEYRYLTTTEGTGKKNSTSNFHSNILMLKAKYMF
ncbi:MAG: porin family protein [Lactobacillales bacterium]|jgi:opacity protein-like surface antigen|nr:porin family protein [Lactobacillales bacterium]